MFESGSSNLLSNSRASLARYVIECPRGHMSPVTLTQFQHTLKTILLCSAYRTWFGAFVAV